MFNSREQAFGQAPRVRSFFNLFVHREDLALIITDHTSLDEAFGENTAHFLRTVYEFRTVLDVQGYSFRRLHEEAIEKGAGHAAIKHIERVERRLKSSGLQLAPDVPRRPAA